jgi:hypothetical protein
MGFEVTFKYHERKEKGGYNTEETKELSREIGKTFEEVSLEKLAASIMMQMARRDIWVVDCDIVELTRKKVSFRETDGGVIIKNKKFTLDTIANEVQCEDLAPQVVDVARPTSQSVPQAPVQKQVAQPPDQLGAPQRMEAYDPDPQLAKLNLVKGFTPGKRYPIFKEMRDPREGQMGRALPMLYLTVDDSGKQRRVPQDYFVPVTAGLGKFFEDGNNTPRAKGDGLVWDGVVDEGMPLAGGASGLIGGAAAMAQAAAAAANMPSIRGGGGGGGGVPTGPSQNLIAELKQQMAAATDMPNIRR